jgi:hypothetical protein
MSISHDGESDIADPREHARRGMEHMYADEATYELTVPALPMTVLLDRANTPKNISLLSLDVEGSEIEVLKGIDFNKYTFQIMLIESRNVIKIKTFLENKNYVLISKVSHHDYLLRHSNFFLKKDKTIFVYRTLNS